MNSADSQEGRVRYFGLPFRCPLLMWFPRANFRAAGSGVKAFVLVVEDDESLATVLLFSLMIFILPIHEALTKEADKAKSDFVLHPLA